MAGLRARGHTVEEMRYGAMVQMIRIVRGPSGTELIAAIGDMGQTSFTDTAVASGETWFYRVAARADQGGGTFIACQTQVLSVTIP